MTAPIWTILTEVTLVYVISPQIIMAAGSLTGFNPAEMGDHSQKQMIKK